jgi:hypothetical protein
VRQQVDWFDLEPQRQVQRSSQRSRFSLVVALLLQRVLRVQGLEAEQVLVQRKKEFEDPQ